MILTLENEKLNVSHEIIRENSIINQITIITNKLSEDLQIGFSYKNEEPNFEKCTYSLKSEKGYNWIYNASRPIFNKIGIFTIYIKQNGILYTTTIKIETAFLKNSYSNIQNSEINKILEQNSNEISSISSDLTNSNNMLTEDLNAFKSSTNASNEQISNTLIELQNTINELNSKIAKLEENQTILEENEKLLLEQLELLT